MKSMKTVRFPKIGAGDCLERATRPLHTGDFGISSTAHGYVDAAGAVKQIILNEESCAVRV